MTDNRSCYEVIDGLDKAIRETLTPSQQYFVLGGIATAAINHPESVFDHQTDHLIAAPESTVPVLRDNGTRRDVDMLVLDVLSPDQATAIKRVVSAAVGDALEVSVFGLSPHRDMTTVRRLGRSLTAWTSERTIDDNGILRYELFPLEQIVSQESYSPWTLELPSGEGVAIFNPAAHMLAYYLRSISGLRAKDVSKVDAMRYRVMGEPIFQQQIFDGPLQSWWEMANDIGRLGDRKSIDRLLEEKHGTKLELEAAHWRGKLLKTFESNATIVTYAQKGLLQKLLKSFVGNR